MRSATFLQISTQSLNRASEANAPVSGSDLLLYGEPFWDIKDSGPDVFYIHFASVRMTLRVLMNAKVARDGNL
jgi:hypothetical protein